ncbi:hypothetical protein ACI3L1_03630 [Deinococcus sp. SM5_A1]|uniref:hypothetical protein n=1 Tax=Deinococcus sp. SM5_A1 TaxID=3379094 RepID=UPI00385D1CDB
MDEQAEWRDAGVSSDQVILQETFVGKKTVYWCHFSSQKENIEYISRLSTNYHRFKLESYSTTSDGEDLSQNALLALQQNYFELLEYSLALCFASIQSLHATPLWMTHYKNYDLDDIVQIIIKGQEIPSASGTTLDELIEEMAEDREGANADALKICTQNLIRDYSRIHYMETYNAIKHGNRASPSQFNFETDKASFKIKCGFIAYRKQALHKNELESIGGKKAFYLEQHITPINDVLIYAQNTIVIRWLDILIDTLQVAAGIREKPSSLSFVTLEEVQRAWDYPKGFGSLVITPNLTINGKQRIAQDYNNAATSGDFQDIEI